MVLQNGLRPLHRLLCYFHIKTLILSLFYAFLSCMLRDTILSGTTYFSTDTESISENKCIWLAKNNLHGKWTPFCYLFLLEDNVPHAIFKAECSSGLDKINGSPSFVCEKPVKIMWGRILKESGGIKPPIRRGPSGWQLWKGRWAKKGKHAASIPWRVQDLTFLFCCSSEF